MVRALLCVTLAAQTLTSLPPYAAPKYRDGAVPPVLLRAVAGGEVWLEVPVTRDGVIPRVTLLRSTPPFTDALTTAVNGWRFAPAEAEIPPAPDAPPRTPSTRDRVDATVFVGAVFLPPSLNAPTLGEPPKDLAAPSSPGTPFPIATTRPMYPLRAVAGGVVLVEALVGRMGDVEQAKVLSSAPGFDQAALDAARQWKFTPSRVQGINVPSYAYLVFGFAQPVTR